MGILFCWLVGVQVGMVDISMLLNGWLGKGGFLRFLELVFTYLSSSPFSMGGGGGVLTMKCGTGRVGLAAAGGGGGCSWWMIASTFIALRCIACACREEQNKSSVSDTHTHTLSHTLRFLCLILGPGGENNVGCFSRSSLSLNAFRSGHRIRLGFLRASGWEDCIVLGIGVVGLWPG